MRETIRDWQNDWLDTNGPTHELEVLITDSSHGKSDSYIYEGSFIDIPVILLDRRVIKSSQVLASSVPERVGTYSLTI